jgi:GntR family transcriptional regulator/MocR family aminotransferase
MLIPVNLVPDQPLQQQLFEQLRELIVAGRLRPGTRMPSSRMLADQFAISRNTAVLTYERLIAEGYLQTAPAKGTFVAAHPAQSASQGWPPRLIECTGHADPAAEPPVGRPDPSLFPAVRWRVLMRGALDGLGAHAGTDHPAGQPAMRNAIANWLSASRGLAVAPDQVVLTHGRQQALHLVAHLALQAGARAVVEDPCDANAAAALVGETAELVRVPVDEGGLCTDRLPDGEAALVHVTPEHQRPLGVALARSRRTELLAWAARAGALVLEEDCEGELRYGDMHLPALMSLDTTERVVLLGGVSSSLGPWLDLAYLVLPHRLIRAALVARRLLDDSRNGLEQVALAELFESGGYARHLHRLRKDYAGRRDALTTALRRHFDARSRIWGDHAGLHLAWFPLPETGSSPYLAAMARRCGLDAAALPADMRARVPAGQAVLIGFGMLPERHIEARVGQFAALLRETSPGTALSAD